MTERVILDRQDPCGVCGAPWSHREKELPFEEGGVWLKVSGGDGCSARCQDRDPVAYEAELSRRRALEGN